MSTLSTTLNYGAAIRSAFEYLLGRYPECFVLGQGLWSPWYVGNSMTELDKQFGAHRVIDTPVSELACTGAGVGAAISGMKPIVVHPRVDFMLYGIDAVVNQAAKWRHMFGGQASAGVTVRAIINRGGEQGAQHSQALHVWFAHVPGLRVVMPATVADARDLLIASVLSPDPVMFMDDRWLYDLTDTLPPIVELDLAAQGPKCLAVGTDITLVAAGFSTQLALETRARLGEQSISAEVVDVRVLNPFEPAAILKSVVKTRRLLVIDGGCRNAGFAAEVISSVVERLEPRVLLCAPRRVALPDTPAPTSRVLEQIYYPSVDEISSLAATMVDCGAVVG